MNKKRHWWILASGLSLGFFLLLESGWSADPAPPVEELEEMVVTAKSKAQQEALARRYEEEAKGYQRKAGQHKKLAAPYEQSDVYGKLQALLIEHCNAMVRKFNEAAQESLALAKLHHQLAAEAKK
jgi:hypothetical protein